MSEYINFDSPVGIIGLSFSQEKLTGLEILSEEIEFVKSKLTGIAKHTVDELKAYFKNPQHKFDIPMMVKGSDFQQSVWKAMQRIPSGDTLTYGQVAKQLKSGPRAVGQACRTNRILIVIPCHRIIASTHPGGYSGAMQGRSLEIKKWLLHHENR